MQTRRRIPFLLVLAVALVAPRIGEAQTSLSACYIPQSGTLYVVDPTGADGSCLNAKHVKVSLLTSAPTASLPGVFHAQAVTLEAPSGSPNANFGEFRATCANGWSVISFGYTAQTSNQPSTNSPAINGTRYDWVFRSALGSTWSFHWVCAPVTLGS